MKLRGLILFALLLGSLLIPSVQAEILVYNDAELTIPTDQIYWGNPSPGDTVIRVLYVRNTGLDPVKLSMVTQHFDPPRAADQLKVSWNMEDYIIGPGEVREARIKLEVSPLTDLKDFSIEIIITGERVEPDSVIHKVPFNYQAYFKQIITWRLEVWNALGGKWDDISKNMEVKEDLIANGVEYTLIFNSGAGGLHRLSATVNQPVNRTQCLENSVLSKNYYIRTLNDDLIFNWDKADLEAQAKSLTFNYLTSVPYLRTEAVKDATGKTIRTYEVAQHFTWSLQTNIPPNTDMVIDPGITRVQGNARGAWASGTTISVTLGDTPVNGNVLVAAIGLTKYSGGAATVSSITQTNVAWTKQINDASDGSRDSEIWLGIVSASAGTAITINLDSTPNVGTADVCEYSGIDTVSPLDKTASAKGYGTATSTGTTAATSQNDELWIGSISARYAVTTHSSPTNGFTLLDGTMVAYLEKIVNSTGAANTGTTLSGADYWVGVIATFKAAAGGPTNYPRSATQGITISSNADRWFQGSRGGAQAIGFTPDGERIYGAVRTPTQAIALASAATRILVLSRAASQAINMLVEALGVKAGVTNFIRGCTQTIHFASNAMTDALMLLIHVVDAMNHALTGSTVSVWGPAGTLVSSGTVNGTGYYVLNGIVTGNYTVQAIESNYQPGIETRTVITTTTITMILRRIDEMFNMELLILVGTGMLLSIGFYLGERVMPWFIAIIMGALSGIIFLASGFYWTVTSPSIQVYGWLFTLWGIINLILVTYFSIGLMRANQGAYPDDQDLYGNVT